MSDKESFEAFKREAIPAFVDLLQIAKEAIVLYRKGERDGETPSFDEIDFKDVLMTASCMAAMGLRRAPDPFEESVVRLDPAKVHDACGAELERRRIDPKAAGAVLKALIESPAGREMLKLMVYDSVMVRRRDAGQDGAPRTRR